MGNFDYFSYLIKSSGEECGECGYKGDSSVPAGGAHTNSHEVLFSNEALNVLFNASLQI